MQTRSGRKLAAISAVSLLLMTSLAIRVFAGIELDNDVILDWQLCNESSNCGRGVIVGAPRLVTDLGDAGTDLELTVDADFPSVTISFLDLVVRQKTVECLDSQSLVSRKSVCVRRLHLIELQDPHTSHSFTVPFQRPISAFGESVANDFVGNLPPGEAVITVEARISTGGPTTVTMTLSGDGHQVAINRLGDVDDFKPGGALDIPARSTELAQVLSQLDSALLPRRAPAELDAPAARGADVAVGFTHAFDLPREGGGIVDGGSLLLRVKREGGDFSKDFILLDGAVRALQNGRPRVPLIFLRDLRASQVRELPDIYEFDINLAKVPISVLTAGNPVPSALGRRDVTADLEDGRLNVIVVGKSVVDFSDLTVTFDDPPARQSP
jgi:hypothetical protein